MAKKKRKNERLPPRRDGKKRTRRQQQTLVNNRNFQARKFYDEVRPKWRKELLQLRRDNRSAVYLVASLRHQLNSTAHELAELRKKK